MIRLESSRSWRAREVTAIFVTYLLPWWVLIPVITFMLHKEHVEGELDALREAQVQSLHSRASALREAILRLGDDIQLVALITRSTRQRSGPGPAADDALAEFFGDFLAAHPHYLQARLLNNECYEQVRLDVRGRTVHRVPAGQLQDKSDRPYCAITRTLPPGRSYLSPLDANVENGKVVIPLVPTMRIASHLTDTNGTSIGVAVLNLDAQPILDAVAAGESSGLSLLDEQGYWLYSPVPTEAFGFATGHPELRLPVRHPEVWRTIRGSAMGSGQFVAESGMWSYLTIAPQRPEEIAAAPSWYVVSQVPHERLSEIRAHAAAAHIGFAALALFAISTLSLALAGSRIARHLTMGELAERNRELAEAVYRLEVSKAELVHQEKLSSLGLLVAGVAHELNTPLGAAMLAASTLQDKLKALLNAYARGLRRSDLDRFATEHAEGSRLLLDNLARAARLCAQFKQVAAERAGENRQRFDLGELVQDLIALARSTLKESPHSIIVRIPEGIRLDSYPGPLGQVIQNLVHNAVAHAYPSGVTGTILISARREREHAVISVIDDGTGIPAAHRERIWDPFFTTRRGSGGTGLGLHICQQIVTAVLGGRIDLLAPKDGGGTHMRIEIPLCAPRPPEAPDPEPGMANGTGQPRRERSPGGAQP